MYAANPIAATRPKHTLPMLNVTSLTIDYLLALPSATLASTHHCKRPARPSVPSGSSPTVWTDAPDAG